MDKIWDRKSFEVGGHWPLWRGWIKTELPRRSSTSRMLNILRENNIIQYICIFRSFIIMYVLDFIPCKQRHIDNKYAAYNQSLHKHVTLVMPESLIIIGQYKVTPHVVWGNSLVSNLGIHQYQEVETLGESKITNQVTITIMTMILNDSSLTLATWTQYTENGSQGMSTVLLIILVCGSMFKQCAYTMYLNDTSKV